jgi:hypothetical protein
MNKGDTNLKFLINSSKRTSIISAHNSIEYHNIFIISPTEFEKHY